MGKVRVTSEVMDAAKEIVFIVRHIVDHPSDVDVRVRGGEYRLGLELFTHPSDVGQVVGRSGHLTTSLRSFLSALAGKHKIKIDFDYVTEEDNARGDSELRQGSRPVATAT
jgi:predicted RNA-binding protein YlqC (UPF0109 family)